MLIVGLLQYLQRSCSMDSERRNELAKKAGGLLRSAKDKAKRYAENGSQKSFELFDKMKVKANSLQTSTPPKLFGRLGMTSSGYFSSPSPSKPAVPGVWTQPLSVEDEKLKNLCALGFSVAAARHALQRCGGCVEDAGIWLLDEANADEIVAAEVHTRDVNPLNPGSIARINGLRGSAHLNGVPVMLQCWDDEAKRWVVQMPDGSAKSVRPRNLDLLDDEAAALAAAEMENAHAGPSATSPASSKAPVGASGASVPVAPSPGSPLDSLLQESFGTIAERPDIEELRNQVLEMLGDSGPDAAETLQALSAEELLEVVASLGNEGEGAQRATSSSAPSSKPSRGVPPVADAAEAAALEAALLASSSCAAAADPADREQERLRHLQAAEERQRAFESKRGSMEDYRRQKAECTGAFDISFASSAPATDPPLADSLQTASSSTAAGAAETVVPSQRAAAAAPAFAPPPRVGAEDAKPQAVAAAFVADASSDAVGMTARDARERRDPEMLESQLLKAQRKEEELLEMERRLKETSERVAKAEAEQASQAAANAELLESQARWRAEAEEAARQVQRLEKERAAEREATGITTSDERPVPSKEVVAGDVDRSLEEERAELARLQAKAQSEAEDVEIRAERARLAAEDRELQLQEEEAKQRRLGNALREEQARLEQQRRNLALLQQSIMSGLGGDTGQTIEMPIDDSTVTVVHEAAPEAIDLSAGAALPPLAEAAQKSRKSRIGSVQEAEAGMIAEGTSGGDADDGCGVVQAGSNEAEVGEESDSEDEEVWDLDWSTVGEKLRRASESASPRDSGNLAAAAAIFRIPPPKEIESTEEDPTKTKMQEKLAARRQIVDLQSPSKQAAPEADKTETEPAAAPVTGVVATADPAELAVAARVNEDEAEEWV